MHDSDVVIRGAVPDDAESIHRFICELADYEEALESVETTPAAIRGQLAAEAPPFDALIAIVGEQPVGFALYFQNYSTWKGRIGIYLEDLFVSADHRGRGVGTALLSELSRVALERGAARLDWQVLDWNEPSIRYYESVGADVNRGWLPCRLHGEALAELAQR